MAPISQPARARRRAAPLSGFALAMAVFSTAPTVVRQEEPMPSDRNVAKTPVPRAGAGGEAKLPEREGPFSRAGETRRIGPDGIFEYMDGAGELYLAYRFDHLEVAEYASRDHGDILVELYWMRASDDAYGLLSQDWGGEPIAFAEPAPASGPRALYGAGLLRIWSDDLYVRVMATRETTAARAAVLSLGRAIVAGRAAPAPPRLAAAMPAGPAPGYVLGPGGACFLRSHLVLNSAYFVSQRDILDLGLQTEAALATYRAVAAGKAESRPRLLLVRYPDAAAARGALAHFLGAFLPEWPGSGGAVATGSAQVEDGWVGFSASGCSLALVFQAPDQGVAESFVAAARASLASLEASHE